LGEKNQPTTVANPVIELPSVEPAAAPVSVTTPSISVAPTVSATQPLATRRSSGRFMDVVHPSSDMRNSFVPQRPVAHDALTVQPPVQAVPVPAQSVETQPDTQSWPDPLDFQALSNEIDNSPVAAVENHDDSDDSEPLESPFIADAKVEKRPLGAFTDTSSPDPAIDEPQLPQQPAEVSELDTDIPIDTDAPLPAELQEDLLLLEAGENTTAKPTPTEVVPQPVAVPAETTSIPQQYVEQPSTGDQPAGSIFDTDSYHKPIAHPKKSKSGWMMLVWIILLIILGVGAGAAFYFYVLPLL
jgi:hypothetical protein